MRAAMPQPAIPILTTDVFIDARVSHSPPDAVKASLKPDDTLRFRFRSGTAFHERLYTSNMPAFRQEFIPPCQELIFISSRRRADTAIFALFFRVADGLPTGMQDAAELAPCMPSCKTWLIALT